MGFVISLLLSVLSQLAIRMMPYRDLPMMPKPFFLFTLLPGFIVANTLPLHYPWLRYAVFISVNGIVFSLATFLLLALGNNWATRRAARSDGNQADEQPRT